MSNGLYKQFYNTKVLMPQDKFNGQFMITETMEDRSNIEKAYHKLEEEKGSTHSCWHMDPRCCSQAVPSYIHQESGRMEACHSHCCTILVCVFGCPRKF